RLRGGRLGRGDGAAGADAGDPARARTATREMTAATLLHAPIAAADRVRGWWLRRLGRWIRPLIRGRELRVAVLGTVMVATALTATLVAPLWLLILGPLVWGVPHLVADLRYMLIRPGYHRRLALVVVAGPPLVWTALGGGLMWGFLAAALALVVARAEASRRLLAIVMIAGLAGVFAALGRTGD